MAGLHDDIFKLSLELSLPPIFFYFQDNGDETFTVTYEAQDPGRQTINVTLDGNEVPQSPIVLNVAPAVDVTKIKLVDFEPEAYVDCINDFNVDIGALPKDLQKNLV